MPRKVGIPRALFYYQYFPMWKTFFEELGAEVVVSSRTSKQILDDGVKSCVDEACLPVKLFFGHVINIKNKVDYLFIPRFTSVYKAEYICPKFGGLPDMVKHSFSDLPEIISTEINLHKSKANAKKAALEIGSYFCDDKKRIIASYQKALASYREFREQVKKGVLPLDILDKKLTVLKKPQDTMLNIAVIGHVYNLYDRYISMDLIHKLRNSNVNVITIDTIDGSIINEKAENLNKKMFWFFGRKALGSTIHLLENENIDGIIFLMSFGCGVDSFVCDLAERRVRRNSDIPFIVLALDEHTGEAGMNTRLEAFLDMIRWRKKDDTDISAFG